MNVISFYKERSMQRMFSAMPKVLAATCIFGLFVAGAAMPATDAAANDVKITIKEIALIDLNGATTVVLVSPEPTVGGQSPPDDTDLTKKLQYTSVVTPGLTRNITIEWGNGDVSPAGTSLRAAVSGIPAGCGTAAGQVTVSSTAQNLITGIGGCSTGTGASGVDVQYSLTVDDASLLVAGTSTSVTITFTLTSDA